MLLWTRTAGFDPADLEVQARALDQVTIPKVGYHLDRWWGLDREADLGRSPFFSHTDLLCTADGGHDDQWKSIGVNHYWFPPAILGDEAVLGQAKFHLYKCDVAFVGNLSQYGHAEWAGHRRRLFDYLKRRYEFREFPGPGRRQIRGSDLADLYATARVIVGDSCLVGNPSRYWSDRIPETTGRGGYLIHPAVEGLEVQHPDLHTYTLGNISELSDMIDQALESDVSENAEANRAHTVANHTYELRMARLASLL